ncbi:hypothetical protein LIER_09352 [Lithospermum erythrorhizon]|uniref:Uncharacterized protein n=1 Tax=Lithospermum erythrorhizon TaxID=34254 RepID=A0AAV3PH03_LITER
MKFSTVFKIDLAQDNIIPLLGSRDLVPDHEKQFVYCNLQGGPPQFSGPPKTWKYQERPPQFSGPPKSWKYPEISKRCMPKGITSTKSRKKESSSVPKKRQLQVDDNQGPEARLPQDFEDSIRALAGGRQVSEPVLVAHKKSFSSDVCPNQSRFLLPALKLKSYLTEDA